MSYEKKSFILEFLDINNFSELTTFKLIGDIMGKIKIDNTYYAVVKHNKKIYLFGENKCIPFDGRKLRKKNYLGKKSILQNQKRTNILLTEEEIKIAKKIGNGMISKGIRKALLSFKL